MGFKPDKRNFRYRSLKSQNEPQILPHHTVIGDYFQAFVSKPLHPSFSQHFSRSGRTYYQLFCLAISSGTAILGYTPSICTYVEIGHTEFIGLIFLINSRQ